MAVNLYSNCSTITTGCFFYSNSNLTSPVSNGKYSDGTNCFTVSGGNGEVTAVASCSEQVYFNMNGPSSADGSGVASSITITSQSVNTYVNGSFINVQTNVFVSIACFGIDNTVYSDGTISTGNHCNTTSSFTGLSSFEVIDAYAVVGLGIYSYGTQVYNIGQGFRDSLYTC